MAGATKSIWSTTRLAGTSVISTCCDADSWVGGLYDAHASRHMDGVTQLAQMAFSGILI